MTNMLLAGVLSVGSVLGVLTLSALMSDAIKEYRKIIEKENN